MVSFRRNQVLKFVALIVLPAIIYLTFHTGLRLNRYFPWETASTCRSLLVANSTPSQCSCVDDATGISFDFCYGFPSNKSVRGRRFSCELLPIVKSLNLLCDSDNYDPLPRRISQNSSVVFVTAVSQSHFEEALALLRNLQQRFPDQRVILYDIGLHLRNRKTVRLLCNVEYRLFPFEKYPMRVRNLYEFRWKPLIIAETLNEFGAIWYMDSSIRFETSDLSSVYSLFDCERENTIANTHSNARKPKCYKFPYLLHGSAGHGIFSVTHPDMYQFFPTDLNKLKSPSCNMYEAGFAFIIRTREVVEDVLKWYVLCSLEDDCMGPRAAVASCSFNAVDRYGKYAKCHRFDQSALNLLMANLHGYNSSVWSSGVGKIHDVRRENGLTPNEKSQLKVCRASFKGIF